MIMLLAYYRRVEEHISLEFYQELHRLEAAFE